MFSKQFGNCKLLQISQLSNRGVASAFFYQDTSKPFRFSPQMQPSILLQEIPALLIITNKVIDVGNADTGRWGYLGTFYQMLVERYCIISCSTSQNLFLPCCVKLLLSLRDKHGSSQIWPERNVGEECGNSRQHQGFPFPCSLLLVSNLAWLLTTAIRFLKCSFSGHVPCCLWFGDNTPKYWEHCQENQSWAPLGLKEPIYCSPSTGIG